MLGTDDTVDARHRYTQVTHPSPARKAVRGRGAPEASVTVRTFAPGQGAPEQELTPLRNGSEFSTEPQVGNHVQLDHRDQAWRRVQVEASRDGVGWKGGTVTARRSVFTL